MLEVRKTSSEKARFALVSRLASMDGPDGGQDITGPKSLLASLVVNSDKQGRYFAHPAIMLRLCWWQDLTPNKMAQWRDDLVDRGEITIRPDGLDIYSSGSVDIIIIKNRQRFDRFSKRISIPEGLRQEVYLRDGYSCQSCGSQRGLSLDHIFPWSKGGADTIENLQTLCRPCNSSKGARA